MSSDEGSVTQWIALAKAGSPEAAEQLWQRYFEQLTRVARRKFGNAPRRVSDEEDAALSAMDSVIRGIQCGRYPELVDRTGLWPLLVTITVRKTVDYVDLECRQKRGSGHVLNGSAVACGSGDSANEDLHWVPSTEPTVEFLAEVEEECDRLIELLGDKRLRQLARLKLAGFFNQEIASRLRISLRSVERKLAVIRSVWSKSAVGNG